MIKRKIGIQTIENYSTNIIVYMADMMVVGLAYKSALTFIKLIVFI